MRARLPAALAARSSQKRTQRARQKVLRVASLFSGCGALDLGFQRAGCELVAQCELCPLARKVVRKRFPLVQLLHDDAATLDALPECEFLIAGPPCQDVSRAGLQRGGIHGARSGLIDHVFRLLGDAIRRGQPVEFVVLEHVEELLNRRGSGGGVPDVAYVIKRLEALGYVNWAHRVINAAAFGRPNRRRRVFIVASLHYDTSALLLQPGRDLCPGTCAPTAADPPCASCVARRGRRAAASFVIDLGNAQSAPAPWFCPTIKTNNTSMLALLAPLTRRRRFGLLSIKHVEALTGLPAGWTAPAGARTHRWRLIGNAVVVDVALWLAKQVCECWRAQPPPRVRPDAGAKRFHVTADAVIGTPRGTWPRCAFGVAGRWYATRASEAPVAAPLVPLEQFVTGPLRPFEHAKFAKLVAKLERNGVDATVVRRLASAFKWRIKPDAKTTTRLRAVVPDTPSATAPPRPSIAEQSAARDDRAARRAAAADCAGAGLDRGRVSTRGGADASRPPPGRGRDAGTAVKRRRRCESVAPVAAATTAIKRHREGAPPAAAAAAVKRCRVGATTATAAVHVAAADGDAVAARHRDGASPARLTRSTPSVPAPTPPRRAPHHIDGCSPGGWGAGLQLDTVCRVIEMLAQPTRVPWNDRVGLIQRCGPVSRGLLKKDTHHSFKRRFAEDYRAHRAHQPPTASTPEKMRYVLDKLSESAARYLDVEQV